MNGITRCLVILAVAGHVALTGAAAFASVSGRPQRSRRRRRVGQRFIHTGAIDRTAGGSDGGPGPGPAPGPAPGPSGHGGVNPAPTFSGPVGVSGACGADLQLPDVSTYANAAEGVAAISKATEEHIKQCGCSTQACIADALDKYAVELKKVAPRLPRALRSLPQIVANVAKKVRAAPTPPAAVRAVKAAITVVQTVVRKAITLMRAADPDSVAEATRGGTAVARTLDTAAKALERAETL